jgi:hypothetical protein
MPSAPLRGVSILADGSVVSAPLPKPSSTSPPLLVHCLVHWNGVAYEMCSRVRPLDMLRDASLVHPFAMPPPWNASLLPSDVVVRRADGRSLDPSHVISIAEAALDACRERRRAAHGAGGGEAVDADASSEEEEEADDELDRMGVADVQKEGDEEDEVDEDEDDEVVAAGNVDEADVKAVALWAGDDATRDDADDDDDDDRPSVEVDDPARAHNASEGTTASKRRPTSRRGAAPSRASSSSSAPASTSTSTSTSASSRSSSRRKR